MGYILEEIIMTLDGGVSAMDNSIVEYANSADVMDETDSISVNIFKQRKTRRGKKKRYKSVGDEEDADVVHTSFDRSTSDPDPVDEVNKTFEDTLLEDSDTIPSPNKKRRLSSVIIRPIHVPKAPENSTQFIIDDHEDSQLYISFEKPFDESNLSYGTELIETFKGSYESDAAFQDIDYEYASADDVDTTQFYARDFETAYYKARFDELMQTPHNKLIDMYHDLEQQVIKLQDQLLQYDPKYALDDLQQELLKHQEENEVLRQHHKTLRKKLYPTEGESGKEYESSSD
ncbi:uncharacterized protein [Centruroides vittatus]|uniref:uncharacterized protein isoform X1 n=2 Tax=Centruroides vittatus TaxID=120091 RepID=UPI00351043EE